MASLPRGLNCHICGKPQLPSSIIQHQKSCAAIFTAAAERSAKLTGSPPANLPPAPGPLPSKRTPAAWQEYNERAMTCYAQGLMTCPRCRRQFHPVDIADHFGACSKIEPRQPAPGTTPGKRPAQAAQTPARQAAPAAAPSLTPTSGPDNRIACRNCGRKFSPDRIDAHEAICCSLRHGPPPAPHQRVHATSGVYGVAVAARDGREIDPSVVAINEHDPCLDRACAKVAGARGRVQEPLTVQRTVQKPYVAQNEMLAVPAPFSRPPTSPYNSLDRSMIRPAHAPAPVKREVPGLLPDTEHVPKISASRVLAPALAPAPATPARTAAPAPAPASPSTGTMLVYVGLVMPPNSPRPVLPITLSLPTGATQQDLLAALCAAPAPVATARSRAFGSDDLFEFDLVITSGPGIVSADLAVNGEYLSDLVQQNTSATMYRIEKMC